MKKNSRHLSKSLLLKELRKKGLTLNRVTLGDKRVWEVDGKKYNTLVQVYEIHVK